MKTGWTTHSWNGAIWLALSPCHMTMTCKINKLEKPGGPLSIFHTLFGRSAAFYGHFRANTVTSEWSTRISTSQDDLQIYLNEGLQNGCFSRKFPKIFTRFIFFEMIAMDGCSNSNSSNLLYKTPIYVSGWMKKYNIEKLVIVAKWHWCQIINWAQEL